MNNSLVSVMKDYLSPEDRCVACLEAGLVQEWVKTSRILVLVEHNNEHGLLVCRSGWACIPADVAVERCFPIDQDFKCDLDSSGTGHAGSDVYVKMSHQKRKLLFELPLGTEAKTFFQQLTRATEAYLVRVGPPAKFDWLKHYAAPTGSGEASLLVDIPAPVEAIPERSVSPQLPRQTIAQGAPGMKNSGCEWWSNSQGATPLAARESVVRMQLAMREEDYTHLKDLRLLTATWNVNGQPPCNVELREWLACDPEPPDVYAIGFQELDLSKEAFLFSESPREEEWLQVVKKGLHPMAKYHQVRLVRLVGMMLVVFVEESLVGALSEVASDTVGTGILGKMGNKGGVAIRMDLHATTICFVCCHLAAHVDEYERRNQDYQDICSRLQFTQLRTPRAIRDHDQVFWLGDMNYRISNLDVDQVKGLLEKNQMDILLQHDQLRVQHQQKKIFANYTEGKITFQPTYKYNPGTSEWDSSEKQRPPAWCDRVLWRGDHVKQLVYRSHHQLVLSDHKPVTALFEIGIKVVDGAKFRLIYEEIMKKLDKLENEFLPQVSVDRLEVRFDRVRFVEPQTQSLIIANTGQVPVEFSFRNKYDRPSYCKDWLKIVPAIAAIKPGEKCDVALEVCVDKRTAWQLNCGEDSLYDILVLHLERGKDIFITVSGTYEPSCYGCSLEALVRVPCPVRELGPEKLELLEKRTLKEGVLDIPFEVPKELWLLVDQIYKYGLTQDDLFQQSGLTWEIQMIRDALDTRLDGHLPGSVHSIAEALLLFLEALPEPVIPRLSYQRCLDCSNNFVLCKQVVSQVPDVHRKTFVYLVSFLKELLAHSSDNKLDAKLLANVFGTVLLRPKEEEPAGSRRQMADRKRATFVYHFLMNDYDD
ncbi:inositol polyphosphate 5-phosphatase OCRL-like isoform X2 [Ornithodoros turicata]|uniref:inositol polyphosphate 5-phosphatase OCRL-like isoform X2 n=1 Tax=Ornithodoros turicata TaxID=34597 RepID=UPI003139B017